MSKLKIYKALANCRVDTFRQKGDVFETDIFEDCPPYLEEIEQETEPENLSQPAGETSKKPRR